MWRWGGWGVGGAGRGADQMPDLRPLAAFDGSRPKMCNAMGVSLRAPGRWPVRTMCDGSATGVAILPFVATTEEILVSGAGLIRRSAV
ncbi:hypothetical protein VT52_030275 [Streptomyces malaysiense]|uniref:Uncharacterized protein n=1 Tax=Streptomyces malaysiense TaxID=1428626 RepID=A0A1J4PSC6_9ACTN|nr:hypothetical protein VT52_030275 [Streptomyces malaysiense]